MDNMPKGLVHQLEYFVSEYKHLNYCVYAGGTTVLLIRHSIQQPDMDGAEVDRHIQQFDRRKSNGALVRQKLRHVVNGWLSKRNDAIGGISFDSGIPFHSTNVSIVIVIVIFILATIS